MKRLFAISATTALSLALTACLDNDVERVTEQVEPAQPANLLLSNNRLAVADLNNPDEGDVILGSLTGVLGADRLVSIDRRPQNGQLYALGYDANAGSVRLYAVHPFSRLAVPLTTAAQSYAAPIGGMDIAVRAALRFEIDFNPAVDRLRVVSSRGDNFRMDPNTGLLVTGVGPNTQDGQLTVSSGPAATTFAGTAYVNNRPNVTTTTQFTLSDGSAARLFIQNPPNDGTLVDARGLTDLVSRLNGFDIAPAVTVSASNTRPSSGIGYTMAAFSDGQRVVRLDLAAGTVQDIRPLTARTDVLGLAIQNPVDTPVVLLADNGTTLLRRTTGNLSSGGQATVTGVIPGETLVGIDFRPATGQLFGLGVNPTTDTATLYRIDPQGGGASVFGTASSITFAGVDLPDPATAEYGVDFNPVPDALRVTTSTGLNLRIPLSGAAPVADGPISSGSATGAAYTNSFGGTMATTLYILNPTSRSLTVQAPPNNGTQINPRVITENGSPVAFTAVPGFDLGPEVRTAASNEEATGSGLALLTVSGSTRLYRINLSNGAATNLGTVSGTGFRGLAIGSTGNLR